MDVARIRRGGQIAWALLGLGAVLAVVSWLLWQIHIVFTPLILAGAIVFLLNPVVTWLQRHRIPRAGGAAIAYLSIVAAVGLTVLLVWPLAASQIDDLREEWPEIRTNIEESYDDLANDYSFLPTRDEIEAELNTDGEDVDLGQRFEQLLEIGTAVFEVLLVIVIAPILAFYLLVDLPHLREVARNLIPSSVEEEVLVVGARLNRAIGGFFRGQLFVAFLVGVMVSAGLAVIGLPFWLIVGMVAGLFNIIPLIGPWVGAVPGIAIALTTRDVNTAIWVGVVMAGAQQIDNHFISPLVMQRAVKLHPVAVMSALLAGGSLAGFLGLLLAVPTAAAVKIVVGHMWRTHVLGQPLSEQEDEWHVADAKPAVGIVERVGDENPPDPPEPGPNGDGLAASSSPEAGPADTEPPVVEPGDAASAEGAPSA